MRSRELLGGGSCRRWWYVVGLWDRGEMRWGFILLLLLLLCSGRVCWSVDEGHDFLGI